MTKLAIISDVHADAPALRDALAQIELLGCEEIVCAGDLLDWGLFPEETIRELRERKVPCIRGNHDRWAVSEGHDTSGWDLTPSAMAFLEALPPSWSRTIEGVRVAVWHARPFHDMHGVYPDAAPGTLESMCDYAECDVLVVGHTHLAFALPVAGNRLVCNPGVLLRRPAEPMGDAMLLHPVTGQFAPGPAPSHGTFGVLELPSMRFTVYEVGKGPEQFVIYDGGN